MAVLQITQFPADWLHVIPIKSIRISISAFKMKKLIQNRQAITDSAKNSDKAYTWQNRS